MFANSGLTYKESASKGHYRCSSEDSVDTIEIIDEWAIVYTPIPPQTQNIFQKSKQIHFMAISHPFQSYFYLIASFFRKFYDYDILP